MEVFERLVNPIFMPNRQQLQLGKVGVEKVPQHVNADADVPGGPEVFKAKDLTLKKPPLGMITVEGYMTVDSSKVRFMFLLCCLDRFNEGHPKRLFV